MINNLFNDSKEFIIYYVISEKHILNYKKIKKILSNKKFILVYDKVLSNKIINKYNEKFIKLDNELENIILELKDNISFSILSTCQARTDPLQLVYLLYKYNIPTIAIQETNQFYLHSGLMNNYILPVDKIYAISDFEKNNFIDYGYLKSSIEVIGWNNGINSNTKNIKKNIKKNILIILNASEKINPISKENIDFQIKLINKFYNYFHHKYQIIVKLHPADNFLNYKKIKNKVNNNIDIYFDQYQSIDLIKISEYIFCTGYSQSILEAILLNKKIILYPLENKMNILNDTNNFIQSFKNIDFKMKNYNYLDSKKIFKINNISNIDKKFEENLIVKLKKFNHNEYKKIRLINALELSIWMHYFNKIDNSYYLINNLSVKNKSQTNIIKYLNNFYKNKIVEKEIIFLLKYFYKKNIFFVFKYLLIRKFNKNRDFDLNIFEYLYQDDPRYMVNLFFYEFQNFLNLILHKKEIKIFNELFDKHYLTNKSIYNSKSILFKIYIYLRKNYYILNYVPFFTKLNYNIANKLFLLRSK